MLKQELNEKIQNTPPQVFLNELNYNSKQKVKNALNKFINCESIDKWLNSGFYDLVYNPEDFLIALCDVLKIDKKRLYYELNKSFELKKEIEKFKDSYLFVNTNFKRKNEPIFALSMLENKRRISLYKDEQFLFKNLDEILELVSNIVILHYETNDTKCSIWADIVNYQLNLFGDLYTYSVDGKIINEDKNLDVNIALIKI